MRSLPPWVWLLLAVISGIVASFTALNWLKGQARMAEAPPPARVVVARQAISPGTRLNLAQVEMKDDWPRASLPGDCLTRLEEVEGWSAAAPLAPGEPITRAKLKKIPPTLTYLLPPDKRAMTVKVDEASGVAGFVTPESRVDVLVTIDRGEYGKNPVSKVIFQNLKVLGIGQRMETRPDDKPQVVPTVTLEVTAAQGERLALAAQEGRISLVLRGQGDDRLVETPGASASGLFGQLVLAPPEPPAPPPSPRRKSVEVIRGLQREPVSF